MTPESDVTAHELTDIQAQISRECPAFTGRIFSIGPDVYAEQPIHGHRAVVITILSPASLVEQVYRIVRRAQELQGADA